MTRQLALDLGHRTALGREDFLISACNAPAVEWVDRWPEWPGSGLLVWGAAACGKTHLGHVWCARSKAQVVAGHAVEAVDAATMVAASRHIFVDDAAAVAGERGREEALLHLYNLAVEEGGSMLLAAATPPARWRFEIADLASRLRALSAVEIGAPDDGLLAAVLVKQFADRQVVVGEDVVAFLLARMERSFEGAAKLVAAIDRRALEARRPVTIPLAREVLEAIG